MRALKGPPRIVLAIAIGGILLATVTTVVAQIAISAGRPFAEAASKRSSGGNSAAAPRRLIKVAAQTDKQPGDKPPVGKAQVVPLADDANGPDLSALRYYLSQGQKERVEIEIRRLKKLYPNWEVPQSVFDTRAAGAVDEQPLWDLYAAGEMQLLRQEIAKRMREEPGWKPSDDLMSKIKLKEMRNKITNLWKAGKWKDLVKFVKKEGYGGADADIDIMWTVAEAYARTKRSDDALGIYQSILRSNNNPEQRLATVQKAMAALRMSDVEKLIAMAKTDANGKSELAPIAIDITRARISAFLHDERKEEIAEKEVEAFEDYAKTAKDPDQPGLIAWYNYKRKVLPNALEWFKFAIGRGGDSMIAHGLAHTLRELKLKRDTEEVSYAWREPLVNNSILFVDILERDLTRQIPPYIEPARLRRYAQVTMDTAAGEGAQGLGWYAYNTCQFKVALRWFQHAVAWHPKEATVYGLAITMQRLKMRKEFWELINRYDGLFPKVIEIIYPDDYYHPPTPCEVFRRKGHKAAKAVMASPVLQQPSTPYQALAQAQSFRSADGRLATGAASSNDPSAAPVWQTQRGGLTPLRLRKNIREPRISRRLFPVSVDGQNPLRRWPVGRLLGRPAPNATARRGAGGGTPAEPAHQMKQLVARRVPGVGAMPYERWGYQLLPAYNGRTQASEPHTAVKAAKGTLWMTLHAKDAKDTLGSRFDPDTPDGARRLAQALEAIARAPKVPSPEESKTGPWSAPEPYKSEEQREAEKDPTRENIAQAESKESAAAPAIRASISDDARRKALQRSGPEVVQTPVAGLRPTAAPAPHAKAARPSAARLTAGPERQAVAEPVSIVESPAGGEAAGGRRPGLRIETGARDELGRRATDLYNDGKYADALRLLNQRAARYPETTKLTLLRAWALLNLRRVEEAKQVFASIGGRADGAAAAH